MFYLSSRDTICFLKEFETVTHLPISNPATFPCLNDVNWLRAFRFIKLISSANSLVAVCCVIFVCLHCFGFVT